MSITLWRLSISNEVANCPIRQNQQCEPTERRMGPQQALQAVGMLLLLSASSLHFILSSFPPFFTLPPFFLPSTWPCVLLNLLRKCAVWLWRLSCDEIFKSSNKMGGGIIQWSCLLLLLLCVQSCAALKSWWQRHKMGNPLALLAQV